MRRLTHFSGVDGSGRLPVSRPVGDELERIRACYFAVYPDGRNRLAWPGITHIRVKPTWIRYSDFTVAPPLIVELTGDQLS